MGGNRFTILLLIIASIFSLNSAQDNTEDDVGTLPFDSTEDPNEGKRNWPTLDPSDPTDPTDLTEEPSSEESTEAPTEVGETSATETPDTDNFGTSEGPKVTGDNIDDGKFDKVDPDDDDDESGVCLLSKCRYAYSQVICPENTSLKNYTHSGCKGPYLKFKCCGPKGKGEVGPGAKYLWPPKMLCEWTDCQPTKTPENKRCERGLPNGKISYTCDVYMASYRCCWWQEREATENDLD